MKLLDEIGDMKANFLSINEKASYLEEKLRFFQENEVKYEDLKRNFQMLCETNEELKERLDLQCKETTQRDELAKEWEDTLSTVNQNIRDLNIENEALKMEREDLFRKIDAMERSLEEADSLKNSFDKQLELIEKLRQELQQVQNTLLEKSEEVNTERKENEKYRRLLEISDTNLKEQLKEQERNLKHKVNEVEMIYTERHKSEMDHFREDMLKSLEKMETIKNKTEEDLIKV